MVFAGSEWSLGCSYCAIGLLAGLRECHSSWNNLHYLTFKRRRFGYPASVRDVAEPRLSKLVVLCSSEVSLVGTAKPNPWGFSARSKANNLLQLHLRRKLNTATGSTDRLFCFEQYHSAQANGSVSCLPTRIARLRHTSKQFGLSISAVDLWKSSEEPLSPLDLGPIGEATAFSILQTGLCLSFGAAN